jgi:HEAT repeat protein
MIAQEIVQLLEEPTLDRRPIKKKIADNASLKELLNALGIARNSLTKQILCELLGNRKDNTSVPILLDMLHDEIAKVRCVAADSIAKIGSPSAGVPLLDRLLVEKDKGVKHMIVLALGSVGYSPSIPKLMECLSDSDGTLRGCAAWSLGVLKAEEAKEKLRAALKKEENEYAKNRMTEALRILNHEQ